MPPDLPESAAHVVAGHSAAGCLLAGVRSGLMAGSVVPIDDDFSHGPLAPPDARDAYWQASMRGYSDAGPFPAERATLWDEVTDHAELGHDIVVWGGANPTDVVLLNGACAELLGSSCRMWQIDVSSWSGGPHYVAEYEPQHLVGAYPEELRAVGDDERTNRAAEFNRLARSTGVLRRFELGEVIGAPADTYDSWLLQAGGPQWASASQVVGGAMARCDSHNKMSDVFFAARLQALIDRRELEASGPRTDLRSYQVRVPG